MLSVVSIVGTEQWVSVVFKVVKYHKYILFKL
jgi:hypothetical protein